LKATGYGNHKRLDHFKHHLNPVLRTPTTLSFVLFATLMATASHAVERISAIVGANVVTQGGQRVGQVVDLALDPTTHRIDYYVVSIGSFLVQDSLIAVHPDAMTHGPAPNELTISASTDALTQAQRFNAASWPDAADLFAGSAAAPAQPTGSIARSINSAQSSPARGRQLANPNATGSATISDGRRQATLADGKKEIAEIEPVFEPAPTPTSAAQVPGTVANPQVAPLSPVSLAPAPYPAFAQLDDNNDGRLSRREIGPHLRKNQGYSRLDLDDSGGIDQFEYDVLRQTQTP